MPHATAAEITLLLVEDNAPDARLVELALAEAGDIRYRLTQARRLDQAIERLGQAPFDAILLDLSLPDSFGLETLREMQQAAPSVPIIVLSGLQDETTAIEAVKLGAQDYLVKGHDNGTLISRAIRYALERKRAEEALHRARDELEQRVAERTAELVEANRQLRQEIAERVQAEDALRAREHQLALITDALPVLIAYIDDWQIYRFNNQAYANWFGCGPSRLRGHSIREVWGDADYAQLEPSIEEALHGTTASFEGVLRRPDGEQRYVSASYIPDRNESGKVEGIFELISDITERKLAEDQERRHALELAHVSRLSAMGEMTTQIAHELNQPLTAIATYGDACLRLLDSGKWTQEELGAALRDMVSQARRAGEVIRRLRRFVRKDEASKARVDLNEAVEGVVRLCEVEARWHAVQIGTELAADPLVVQADKILIEQVLLNLLRNAIEAMVACRECPRRLTIRTRLRGDAMAEVAVRDSGPGIAPENLPRIFESFFTTKAEGMGMGLAISRSIAKAHGGQLSAECNADGGSTFVFTLPLAESSDAQ